LWCITANTAADVAYGSFATEPSQAKIHRCPLLPESDQILRRSELTRCASSGLSRCDGSVAEIRRQHSYRSQPVSAATAPFRIVDSCRTIRPLSVPNGAYWVLPNQGAHMPLKARSLALTKSQAACLIALRNSKASKPEIAIQAKLDLIKTAKALGT